MSATVQNPNGSPGEAQFRRDKDVAPASRLRSGQALPAVAEGVPPSTRRAGRPPDSRRDGGATKTKLLESPAMQKRFGFVLLISLGGFLFAEEPVKFEPLPVPVSNNAVTSVKSRGSLLLYSLMGMGAKKTWDAATNAAYTLDPYTGKWAEMHAVPGTVGRLAATAVGAREHVFLFGGYVVDGQGGENTLPDVNVYEPLTDRWFRAEDMPVAVDDSVAGRLSRPLHLPGEWLVEDGRGARCPGVRRAEKQMVASHAHSGHACVRPRRSGGGRHHCVHRRCAQEPGRRPAEVHRQRTNAGWARSTITISRKFNGRSCPAIRERRATVSRREVRRKTRRFIFPAGPTIPTTTTASDTTESRRSRPR